MEDFFSSDTETEKSIVFVKKSTLDRLKTGSRSKTKKKNRPELPEFEVSAVYEQKERPKLVSSEEGQMSIAKPTAEDNSIYNLFFRKCYMMKRLKVLYNQNLYKEMINTSKHLILIKNFDPYFFMEFLTPNMHVKVHISQEYKFDEPFKLRVDNPDQYVNLMKAFVIKSRDIKNLIRFGKDIKPKHLNIESGALPNYEFYFQKEINIYDFLNSFGNTPLLVFDCTVVSGSLRFEHRKRITNISL
jgi:hypothetical protein